MRGKGFIVYLVILAFHFRVSESSKPCNRKCGSRTVPYPFGFSEGCPNRLNCTGEGNITIGGFKVQNITAEAVLIRHEFQCQQQPDELLPFRQQYALTSRNILLVKNCTEWEINCPCNVSLLPRYLHKGNDQNCSLIDDYRCFNSKGPFIEWKDLAKHNCNPLLTSMVLNRADLLELEVDLGTIELGWWVEGSCSTKGCSRNANCSDFLSPATGAPAYRCSCKPGFVGDGFVLGDGCRSGSGCNPSRYISGRCGGRTRVAVLIGGLIGGATLVAVIVLVYCFFKRRSAALQNSKNRKRLLSANGGSSFNVPIFTYRELEKATKGFSDKERLGNGAFGTVYAGRLRSDRPVAVKKIRQIDNHGVEQVMNEIKLLSSVDHPNLVRLLGCCLEKGEPILVYEYMPNGTLSQHLQHERGDGLSWTHRLTLATETARALAYLHSSINPPVYHRDVKSSNILLDYNFNCKVGDFGLSRVILTESSHVSTVPQGTPGYVDPQYHQNFHLSDKSDVYSFGVVLVEIITALKVVDFSRNKSEINLASLAIYKIGSGRVDEIIDPFLEADQDPVVRGSVHRVAELAFRCLAFDRDARPTMVEVADELAFIRCSTAHVKEPPLPETPLDNAVLSDDNEDNDDSSRRHPQRNSSGSRRITIPDIKMCIIRQKTARTSPVSVQDPWVSGQSSPSTSSLLDNVIE
uniref:TSA: Wollemia nobilis Ref_Wollemi_Transcript_25023_2623 transcribed RNA sequence n=1 Tax=Wollemia nobilis TaxID=56998 RepID=A0A0C9RH15_9CONI